MDERERLHWVDIARAFFIIAIVFGHIVESGIVYKCFFSFHVPAFFFISGYCFKFDENWGKYIGKKIKSIVIPYVVFSILSIVFFAALAYIVPSVGELLNCNLIENLKIMVYGNSKPDVMKYNMPLWFLTCFFCVTLLAYGSEIITRSYTKNFRYITIVIGILTGAFMSRHETIAWPWHLETAFSMLVWYLLGIEAAERDIFNLITSKVKNKKTRYGLSFILIAAGGALAMLNIRVVGVRNEHYGLLWNYYLAAAIQIMGFSLLSISIGKNKILEYLGRNSLSVLVMHKFPIFAIQLIPIISVLVEEGNTLIGNSVGFVACAFVILITLLMGEIIKLVFPVALGMQRKKRLRND